MKTTQLGDHSARGNVPILAVAALGMALLFGARLNASTITVVDQNRPGSNIGVAAFSSVRELAQTFPVSIGGKLERVEVWINDTNTAADVLWDIRPTVAGVPDASNASVLASGVIAAANVPAFPSLPATLLELGSFNIAVSPGDVLAVTLRTSSTEDVGWRTAGSPNPGAKFVRTTSGGSWNADAFSPDSAHSFATYVTVPEPAVVVMLMWGAGLVALRRRR